MPANRVEERWREVLVSLPAIFSANQVRVVRGFFFLGAMATYNLMNSVMDPAMDEAAAQVVLDELHAELSATAASIEG